VSDEPKLELTEEEWEWVKEKARSIITMTSGYLKLQLYSDLHTVILSALLSAHAKGKAEREPLLPLPSGIRKSIEQALQEAEHPKGMSTHSGLAVVASSHLRYMLLALTQLETDFARAEREQELAALAKQREIA